MFRLFARLVVGEEGQDLIEYGLLAALVALVAVATITAIGDKLQVFYFSRINAALP